MKGCRKKWIHDFPSLKSIHDSRAANAESGKRGERQTRSLFYKTEQSKSDHVESASIQVRQGQLHYLENCVENYIKHAQGLNCTT